MAERKAADEEFNPRHRIVGAVILVALAVIFLPMVLNERPPETVVPGPAEMPLPDMRAGVAPPTPSAARPGQPGVNGDRPSTGGTRVVTVPIESVPSRPPAEPVRPAVESLAPPAPSQPEPPQPVARPVPDSKPDKPARTVTATAKPATDHGWVVQVGVFSQPDNARRLQERLQAKGYSVLLDPPIGPADVLARVRRRARRDRADQRPSYLAAFRAGFLQRHVVDADGQSANVRVRIRDSGRHKKGVDLNGPRLVAIIAGAGAGAG